MTHKIAVLLSGCGYLDGAEISESVCTLLALSKLKALVTCLAPDIPTHHTLNHMTGQEDGESRNVLQESARIARGKVKSLASVNHTDFDGLIIPGGFGVAKNLCQFAFEGINSSVQVNVDRFIKDFHAAKKPIGALCIAPALIALTLKDQGIKLTIGSDPETASAIEKLGQQHVNCRPHEACIDLDHKVATAPAYMYDEAPLEEIFQGINSVCQQVIEWCK